MSYIKIPEATTKTLDKTVRDFIWGSTQERRKMHLLSWDQVTQPKEKGGLHIQKMSPRNKAILSGLAWRVAQGPPATWKVVLTQKYKNHPVDGQRRICVSKTWKNIQDGWINISRATKWMIHQGTKVKFFTDNWLPHFSRITDYVHGPPLKEVEYSLTVADLRIHNTWEFESLSIVFPPKVQEPIKDVNISDCLDNRDRLV